MDIVFAAEREPQATGRQYIRAAAVEQTGNMKRFRRESRMDTLERLLEISSRLDHLESVAEWVAKETIHTDNGVSQTGTLICVLADQIREALFDLCKEIELANQPPDDQETFH